MSSRGSPQTSTTTSEPPKYVAPHLEQGAQEAQNLYNRGGTPVVGFSPQSQQALQMAQARATTGSPVNQAAQQYATKTLQGGFMGSNPYLDQTFNRAAMGTQNQLASQFGRSGRNAAESQFLRGEQLNNLATNIYGGDYEAERARQQQMVPFAGQLAQQDYTDIGQLANVGETYDQQAQAQANQPQSALDAYLAQLQGFPGGSVTQQIPTNRNRLAGAFGGAQMGSQWGPWGMLGGGILGGVLG
jgi:hypothetical protein